MHACGKLGRRNFIGRQPDMSIAQHSCEIRMSTARQGKGAIIMSDLTNLAAYTDYMTDTSRVATENLQKNLQNADKAAKQKEDDALFDACKQFEAYLWEQVYKEMQKTVNLFGDDEDGYASNMVDYFKDSAIQQISEQTATQGSNSLAQMLYEQAKINYGL